MRMARLLRADRKATIFQITTLCIHGEQKSISKCMQVLCVQSTMVQSFHGGLCVCKSQEKSSL